MDSSYVLTQSSFYSQSFLGPNFFLNQTFFWAQQYLRPDIFLDPKFVGPITFLDPKFCSLTLELGQLVPFKSLARKSCCVLQDVQFYTVGFPYFGTWKLCIYIEHIIHNWDYNSIDLRLSWQGAKGHCLHHYAAGRLTSLIEIWTNNHRSMKHLIYNKGFSHQ